MRILRGIGIGLIVVVAGAFVFLRWAEPDTARSDVVFLGGDIVTMADPPVVEAMCGKIVFEITYREQDFPDCDFYEDYKLVKYLKGKIPAVVWGKDIGAYNAGEGNICLRIRSRYTVDKR